MTRRTGRKFLICWLFASIAHLPFPVIDGDAAGSCTLARLGGDEACSANPHCEAGGLDIDIVLLGCDAPDDSDDGPVDDDPERGDCCFGLCPTYLCNRTTKSPFENGPLPTPYDAAAFSHLAVELQLLHASPRRCALRVDFPGMDDPARSAVLRC